MHFHIHNTISCHYYAKSKYYPHSPLCMVGQNKNQNHFILGSNSHLRDLEDVTRCSAEDISGSHIFEKMSLKKESLSDVQLHLAALHGDAHLLRRILDSGKVHVDSKDKDGTTPLILASANGHYECVKELIEQGADPKSRRITGTTPLFFAAQGGFLDIVQYLLDKGAPVDSLSIDGGSPLFVACQCGHMDVVKELIKRGAQVNTHMKDKASPVFIAAQNGHYKVLVYLLAQGAAIDSRRTDGATPLWIAAQMGHDHIVTQLLRVGSSVDAARHDGATPLFKAAHKGHSAVVAELLKYKPSLGILPNGETALHAAAFSGSLPVCKQLISAGANPILKNQEGYLPSEIALKHRHNGVYDYLKNWENKCQAGK